MPSTIYASTLAKQRWITQCEQGQRAEQTRSKPSLHFYMLPFITTNSSFTGRIFQRRRLLLDARSSDQSVQSPLSIRDAFDDFVELSDIADIDLSVMKSVACIAN